jgi:hypothetical protein
MPAEGWVDDIIDVDIEAGIGFFGSGVEYSFVAVFAEKNLSASYLPRPSWSDGALRFSEETCKAR